VLAASCIWGTSSVQIKLLGDDVEVLNLNAWVALLAAPQTMLASSAAPAYPPGLVPAARHEGPAAASSGEMPNLFL